MAAVCKTWLHPDLSHTQTHSAGLLGQIPEWQGTIGSFSSDKRRCEKERKGKNYTKLMYLEHICEMRVIFGHRNTHRKHTFQRSSLIHGFLICEENLLAQTWFECISGYTWMTFKCLSPYVLSWETGFIVGIVQDPARMYWLLSWAPHVKFAYTLPLWSHVHNLIMSL